MKKIAMVVGCLLLMSVQFLGTAEAARAVAYDCADKTFCSWSNANYSGSRIYTRSGGSVSNLHPYRCPGCVSVTNPRENNTWNDMASSWFNRTSVPYCLYFDAKFQRLARKIEVGASLYHSAPLNDRVTSYRPARLVTSTSIARTASYVC